MEMEINKKMMLLLVGICLIKIVYAIPLIDFDSSTPANAISQSETNVEINVSITGANLDEVVYNWNGTNFTMYNDSLVLMMNFDNRSSLGENDTYVADVSGGGNNGTANAGATYTSLGRYSGALDFDKASTGQINLGDVDELDGTKFFTIIAWVKYDNLYDWDYIFSKLGESISTNSILMGTGGDSYGGSDEAWFRVTNGASCYAYTSENLLDTNWHHWVMVYDGTQSTDATKLKFYFDGIQKSLTFSTDVPTTAPSNSNPLVLSGLYNSVNHMNGTIDEVRIWNRSLLADEVYQQYVSNLNKFNSTQWYLYVNQSKNATDELDDGDYTYQAFASDTIGNWNNTGERAVTIDASDATAPNVNITYPKNTTYNVSINNLNYTYSDTNPGYCWYSTDNGVTNSTPETPGTNWTGLSSSEGSNTWILYCNDSAGNENSSSVTFTSNLPVIGLEIISPTGNVNVTQNEFFEIKTRVSCSNANCGEINVTLDPAYESFTQQWASGATGNNTYGGSWDYDGMIGAPDVTTCSDNSNAWASSGGTSDGAQLNLSYENSVYATNISIHETYVASFITKIEFEADDGTIYSVWEGSDTTSCPGWLNVSFNTLAKKGKKVILYTNGSAGSYEEIDAVQLSGYLDTSSGKGGTISMNSSATPFYTTTQNPYNLTLNEGESEVIIWTVNATGDASNDTDYEFYVYANKILDMSIGNITEKWNVTIVDFETEDITPPQINFTFPTPANGTLLTGDSIHVNLTTNSSLDHYSFVDFNNDVALWMKMDEINQTDGVGSIVYDNSSQENHGTAIGDANQTPNGKFGKAYVFDGNSDYIKLAGDNSLQFTETFSISTWIKPTSWSDYEGGGLAIARRQNNYFLDIEYGEHFSQKNFRFFVYGLNAAEYPYADYNLNEWIHLVGTFDYQDSIKLYINGVEKDSVNMWGAKASYMNNQALIIGAQQTSSDYFNGTIDDVIIFGRTLKPQEISALYNASANQYYNNFTGLTNQTHEFIGYAVDTNGDLNQTQTWQVTVPDSTAPAITIDSPRNTAYNTKTINLNVSADESISTWWYSNDSGANNNTFTPNQTYNWEEGSNTIYVWANDGVGNIGTNNITFTVDIIYPDINITSPKNNTNSSNNQLNINYTFSDLNLQSCWYSNDTMSVNTALGTGGSCTNITTVTWSEGHHNITIWTNDSAGNENSSSITFNIDSIAPNTTLNSPNRSYSNSNSDPVSVTFNCSATEGYDLANISLYITNNSNSSFSLNQTTNVSGTSNSTNWTLSLSNGDYTWNCIAYDSVGNFDWAENRSILINYIAPTTPVPDTGGGTGGGSSYLECMKNSDCEKDYWCYEHKCVKLFDVIILDIDSPLNKEEFFNFTYLVKSIGKINNDVVINFWLEKNGKKVTSGYQTIYFGESQEKIQTTKLFLPGNTERRIYDFYVQANYENYSASAKTTVQVETFLEKEKDNELFSEKPNFWYGLWEKIKLYFKISLDCIKNNRFYFIISTAGVIVFILFISCIRLIIKKIKTKKKKPRNRIKSLIKKKVYTEDGIHIGDIKDIILEENKIYGLKIRLIRKIKARKMLRKKGVIIKYKDVKDVSEIMIVKKDIEDWLKSLDNF